ncbi:MAG: ATP-binding protein [Promethearchaeota archaeon]
MYEKELEKSDYSLKNENDKLFNILDSLDDGAYIVDQEYNIKYLNPSFERQFGPFKGKKCYEYTNNRSNPCPWCKIQEVVDGKTIRSERYYEKNLKKYELIDTPLRNSDGSILKLKLLKTISDCSPLDKRSHQLKIQKAGLKDTHKKGDKPKDIKNKKLKRKSKYPDVQAVEISQNLSKTIELLSNSSKSLKLSVSNLALGYIGEINRQRRINELIRNELIRLKEIDKIKNDMIRRISHELKTPLSSIYTTCDLLLHNYRERMDSKILDYIKVINHGGERLKKLVDNLLDLYLIESNELSLDLEYNDIILTINHSINNIRDLLKKRNHELNINLPDTLSFKFDKIRIEQCITSILENSIKYTPKDGQILLELIEKGDFLEIIISDSGIGFTENEKEQLFKRFGKIERYGQGMDIDVEGPGFGLYLANEIIHLHKGQIIVESQGRNEGSTFKILLPVL